MRRSPKQLPASPSSSTAVPAPTDPRTRVVTAPAGSGKTTLLLQHYVRHLQTYPIDRIVAITFTRKAAAELTGRLAQLLRYFAQPHAGAPPQRLAPFVPIGLDPGRAREALGSLSSAPVCTIDAFALSLVQQFVLHAHFPLPDGTKAYIDGPVESGIDTLPVWEAAARAELEKLTPAARALLAEMSLGEAIGDVARLARAGAPRGPSAGTLLAKIGAELARELRTAPDLWRAEQAELAPRKPELARWLEQPREPVPPALLAFVAGGRQAEAKERRRRVLSRALGGLGFGFESELPWEELRKHLPGWTDAAALARADSVREAMTVLAEAARAAALRALACQGALGYEELLEAATWLCREAPEALATRYDVLMVDELQDTNPAQLAFYEAFASMKRPGQPIVTFFVGDARQSIYRFRQADPHGWRSLVERAERDGTLASLEVNYRSSAPLVELQRLLFGRLVELERRGVDPLDSLRPASRPPDSAASRPACEPAPNARGAAEARPACVVDGPDEKRIDEYVLAEFAHRLLARWQGHPDETAAVLVRSWRTAAWAASVLKAHGLAAGLTGDRALLGSRIAADLRLFLRALLDPSDDLAVAAVLKHPSIGVSDRGLLLLRTQGGFGRLFTPAPDLKGLDEGDGRQLAATLPVLRAARARLGREPTAGVLEWLGSTLHWRPAIAAGPEGVSIGVPQLEILLDVIRADEAERVDPQAVVERLTPSDDATASDLPAVRLPQERNMVTVTTVHAAKGLEYDHVALLEIDKPGDLGLEGGRCFQLARRRAHVLLGVHLDPRGGLTRTHDPVGAFARALGKQEGAEEGERLFYVGLTRAACSVTFGLRKATRGLVAALRVALQDGAFDTLVERVAPNPARRVSAPRMVRPRCGRQRPLESHWSECLGAQLVRPSSQSELQPAQQATIEAFARRARIVSGPKAPPLPQLPGLEAVPEAVWGDLVHGWLARWAFEGQPSRHDALAYLQESWSEGEPRLADWLVELGLALRDGLPGFRGLLEHTLRFELPLLGLDDKLIWAGRADLVVEMPGRQVVIVDFKAGRQAAREGEIPGLRGYALQLDAYRRMLEGAGYRVVEVGLVYVRGVSWVRIPLPSEDRAVA